jgi:hypothetical protein
MVAAKIADMPHGGSYNVKKVDGPNGPSKIKGKSNAEAAEMMNVSERTVGAKIADMPHGGAVYSPPKSDGPNGPHSEHLS